MPLSVQDWFRPAKALSHSPFSKDYMPSGVPFQNQDYSSKAFSDSALLQTSTPIVTKDSISMHINLNGSSSASNTSGPTCTGQTAASLSGMLNSLDTGGMSY